MKEFFFGRKKAEVIEGDGKSTPRLHPLVERSQEQEGAEIIKLAFPKRPEEETNAPEHEEEVADLSDRVMWNFPNIGQLSANQFMNLLKMAERVDVDVNKPNPTPADVLEAIGITDRAHLEEIAALEEPNLDEMNDDVTGNVAKVFVQIQAARMLLENERKQKQKSS
jgi:hypothetical protein